jgi:HAD superfamily hydrolase (TIGR01549 family)
MTAEIAVVEVISAARYGRGLVARIQAVFFDVGEVIIDETREYGAWADWLGVPRHTFSAVFGAVIARGQDYRETFQYFRPGFDLAVERQRRNDAGQPEAFAEENIYPDVRSCLEALRPLGVRVGLAGNQTAAAEAILKSLSFPVDVIGTSGGWGVEKPSAEFFTRIVEEAGCAAGSVLYVGDRIDNDIRPAQQAGMQTALVRRGPWGYILTDETVTSRCLFILDDLGALPQLVRQYNADPANR